MHDPRQHSSPSSPGSIESASADQPPRPARILQFGGIAFVASFALYVFFLQQYPYGDGTLYLQLARDRALYAHHHLYLLFLTPFTEVVGWLGIADERAGYLFSAFMVAAANAVLAGLLSTYVSRARDVFLLVALCATAPTLFFFATTAENHAQHCFWVTVALACQVRVQRRDTTASRWFAGLSVAAVPASHLTGFMLLPFFGCFYWSQGGRVPFFGEWSSRRVLRLIPFVTPLFVYVLLLQAPFLPITPWFKTQVLSLDPVMLADPVGMELQRLSVMSRFGIDSYLQYYQVTALAAAPLTIFVGFLTWVLLVRRRDRRAVLVACALLPYALVLPVYGVPERGAYWVALMPTIAFLASWALRSVSVFLLLALLIQLPMAIYQRNGYPDSVVDPRWTWSLEAGRIFDQAKRSASLSGTDASQKQPEIVLLWYNDPQSPGHKVYWRTRQAIYDHRISEYEISSLVILGTEVERLVALEFLKNHIPQTLARGPVFMTQEAHTALATRQPTLLGGLEREFEFVKVPEGGFEAFQVQKR